MSNQCKISRVAYRHRSLFLLLSPSHPTLLPHSLPVVRPSPLKVPVTSGENLPPGPCGPIRSEDASLFQPLQVLLRTGRPSLAEGGTWWVGTEEEPEGVFKTDVALGVRQGPAGVDVFLLNQGEYVSVFPSSIGLLWGRVVVSLRMQSGRLVIPRDGMRARVVGRLS